MGKKSDGGGGIFIGIGIVAVIVLIIVFIKMGIIPGLVTIGLAIAGIGALLFGG